MRWWLWLFCDNNDVLENLLTRLIEEEVVITSFLCWLELQMFEQFYDWFLLTDDESKIKLDDKEAEDYKNMRTIFIWNGRNAILR